MTSPQTIQIFLPDGSATSIREAQITNRLVQAILFPRNKIQEVSKRKMVRFTGVYFLFGTDDQTSETKVYIGEGEDCYKRIQDHHRNKDFWSHCIIVASKTDDYTKTEGKFLEHLCLLRAEEAGRFKIVNNKDSQKPSISESKEFDLLDNFETMKMLLATLGYPLFEGKPKPKTKELLYCKGKKAEATGYIIDDGFLVLKGSRCNLQETRTTPNSTTQYRWLLANDGTLIEKEGVYVFTKDFIFNSPSLASSCVLGRSSNGWTEWKDKSGRTLDQIKRK